MKKLIFISVLFAIQNSMAHILETDSMNKKIIYAPTPALNLSLIDMESEGGYLTVFLDYDNSQTKSEYQKISLENSGYEIKVANGELVNSNFSIEIPDIDFKKEVILRNGQLGPYLNTQFYLSPLEVKQIKKFNNWSEEVHFNYNVNYKYLKPVMVEEYKVSSSYCQGLNIQNLSDLVSKLVFLKKPDSVKKQITFDLFKKSLFENCFEVESSKIESFAELSRMKIKIKPKSDLIVGRYFETTEFEQNVTVNPYIQADMN